LCHPPLSHCRELLVSLLYYFITPFFSHSTMTSTADTILETLASRYDENQWGIQVDNSPAISKEEVYSLRSFTNSDGLPKLIVAGMATSSSTGDKECLVNIIDPATGEIDVSFDPPGVYVDAPGYEIQCTDAIGLSIPIDGASQDFFFYTGFAELANENQVTQQGLKGVRPFMALVDEKNQKIEIDSLEEILRGTVERELEEIWINSGSVLDEKPVWSHYPVRLALVPPEISVKSISPMGNETKTEVVDVLVLLSSSPTSRVSNRDNIVEEFVARPERATHRWDSDRAYVPPHAFKYGDADPMPEGLPDTYNTPGRGMSLVRVRIYMDGDGSYHAVPLWHQYEHASPPTSPGKVTPGSSVVPTDIVVVPSHPRDPEQGGYVIVSGYSDGGGQFFFGGYSEYFVLDHTGYTEAFVLRMEVDGGNWRNGLRLTDNDVDDIVSGLCFVPPDMETRYTGNIFVVGANADGHGPDGAPRYDAFVQELSYDAMSKMRKVQGVLSDWGELSSTDDIYDMWAGSCVAERVSEKVTVYVSGTTGNTGKDVSLGFGMHDAFLLALEAGPGQLLPTGFDPVAFGTPADDSMHGLVHGGGGLLLDPTDSNRLIIAGNTYGDMYSHPPNKDQEGFPRMFVRSVSKTTGLGSKTLSQECVEQVARSKKGEDISTEIKKKCMLVYNPEVRPTTLPTSSRKPSKSLPFPTKMPIDNFWPHKSPSYAVPTTTSTNNVAGQGTAQKSGGGGSTGVVAGAVVASLLVAGVVSFFFMKRSRKQQHVQVGEHQTPAQEDTEML